MRADNDVLGGLLLGIARCSWRTWWMPAALLLSCNGGISGSAGTVAFKNPAAAANTIHSAQTPSLVAQIEIEIAEVSPSCSAFPGPDGDPTLLPGLYVTIYQVDGTGMSPVPPTPGEYSLDPTIEPNKRIALVTAFNGDLCTVNGEVSPSQGSIQIDSIDDSSVQGALNLTFGPGETVSGSFTAPFCPPLDWLLPEVDYCS